jgi:hypothetical protein
MAITVLHRAPAVLASRSPSAESPRRSNGPTTASPARSFQVLQSSRAPAQLCLFLRPGAADVK